MFSKDKKTKKSENILIFDIYKKTYGIDLEGIWLYNKMVKSKKIKGGGVNVGRILR